MSLTNISGTKTLKSLISVWMPEVPIKIKCMSSIPSTGKTSEEETHSPTIINKRRPSGSEKDLWNSLTYQPPRFKPLPTKTSDPSRKKISTIITQYLVKFKMCSHATRNLIKKIRQNVTYTDSIKPTEKMLKSLILNLLMNGSYPQRTFLSYSKDLKISRDTTEKGISSPN